MKNHVRSTSAGRARFFEAIVFLFAMTFAFVGFADEPKRPTIPIDEFSHLLGKLGGGSSTHSPGGRLIAPAQKGGDAGKLDVNVACLKDLPAKGNPPLKIIDFVGAPKTEDAWFKKLRDNAVAGKVHLGVEDYRGRSVSDYINNNYPKAKAEDARLFFYEDGLIPGLFEAEENYVSLFRAKRDLDKASKEAPQTDDLKRLVADKAGLLNGTKIRTIHGFLNSDWKFNAWQTGWFQNAADKFSPEGKALAKDISELLSNTRLRNNDAQDLWVLSVNAMQREKAWRNDDAWLEVTKALAEAVGKLAEGEANGRGIASMRPYYDLINDPGSVEKENAFGEAIVIGAGAKKAAEKIGEAYCAAAKEGKELNIVTNGTYFQPMVEGLQAALKGKTATDNYDVVHYRQGGQEFVTRNGGAPEIPGPLPGPAPVVDPSVPVPFQLPPPPRNDVP